MPAITPWLWFDGRSEEAAAFYVDVFPDSKITDVTRIENGDPDGNTVVTVEFELDGRAFAALDGGPMFTFTEATSFMVDCADQDEVDYYWERLGDGGEYGPCGWLKDKFGLSWQVVPRQLNELLADPDRGRSARTMQAMLQMGKLDVAALQAAADAG